MVLIQSLLLKRFLFLGLFSKPIRRFISSASWVFCSLKNDKDPGENKGYITFQSSNPILIDGRTWDLRVCKSGNWFVTLHK